jgi:hypothetical protein
MLEFCSEVLIRFPHILGIGLIHIHKSLVCATSDYYAQRPEEMSFDEGDMIAVTRFSPNECWWTGLLLDDHRQNNCQCFLLVQRKNFVDTKHIYGLGWEQIPLSDVPNMPDNGLFRRDLTKLP